MFLRVILHKHRLVCVLQYWGSVGQILEVRIIGGEL